MLSSDPPVPAPDTLSSTIIRHLARESGTEARPTDHMYSLRHPTLYRRRIFLRLDIDIPNSQLGHRLTWSEKPAYKVASLLNELVFFLVISVKVRRVHNWPCRETIYAYLYHGSAEL